MTNPRDPAGLGRSGLPARLADWLSRLLGNGLPSSVEQSPSSTGLSPRQTPLLKKAAQCYALAGLSVDAARLFMATGEFASAGSYFERIEDWEAAADAWSRTDNWESAARCWLLAGQPAAAADCRRRSGRILEGAWLLADQARRYRSALAFVDEFETGEQPPVRSDEDSRPQATRDYDELRVALIRARCDAGLAPTHPRGPIRLRSVLDRLSEVDEHRRAELFDMAIAVATSFKRPDLQATVHRTALACVRPVAAETWSKWSICEFGVTPALFQAVESTESIPGSALVDAG